MALAGKDPRAPAARQDLPPARSPGAARAELTATAVQHALAQPREEATAVQQQRGAQPLTQWHGEHAERRRQPSVSATHAAIRRAWYPARMMRFRSSAVAMP